MAIQELKEFHHAIDIRYEFKPDLILMDIDDCVFHVQHPEKGDTNLSFRTKLLDKSNGFRFKECGGVEEDSKYKKFFSYCNPKYLKMVQEFHKNTLESEHVISDPVVPPSISRLRLLNFGIKFMYFTGRGLDLHKLTELELRKHNLLVNDNIEKRKTWKYITDDAGYTCNTIYAGGRDKGEILERYLDEQDEKENELLEVFYNLGLRGNRKQGYKDILMIDDSMNNLLSVQEMLRKRDPYIRFLGLHYTPPHLEGDEKVYSLAEDIEEELFKEIEDLYQKHKDEILVNQMKDMYQKNDKCMTIDEIKDSTPIITKQRDGKVPLSLIPMKFLKYLVSPLQIGVEKGYTKHSWKQCKLPIGESSLEAAKRHIIDFEEGKKGDRGEYTEKKLDGSPCTTKANHLYAAAFNILWTAYKLEKYGEEVDDRDN